MSDPPGSAQPDADLVRRLLHEQHPDLAGRPVAPAASGWDNVTFRLGDDLAVRMPRRAEAADLVVHEQRWLPELAPVLPLPVPVPLRLGRPGCGYPWSWSVVPWLPGAPASAAAPDDPAHAAEVLGGFVAALHRPAPSGAPANPVRGIPLAGREAALERSLGSLAGAVDATAVRACWGPLADLPAWPGPPVWLHGDLHPANVLVHRGVVSAVVDFGDLTAGDPATDLAIAWMLLPAAARPVLRAAAGGVDDDTWGRARGWALALALAIWAGSGPGDPLASVARRTVDAVLADS